MTTPSTLVPASAVRSASVECRNLNRHFGRGRARVDVLADINLTVSAGEVVALLGPSGCGKSTLLRIIAGLDQPSSGEILIDDQPAHGIDPRTAMVFQEPRLLPWKTVQDNVALGTRGRSNRELISTLIDSVGLVGFANHLPKEISGGMAQRAALTRALAGSPGVLLLDEPFAALDALTRLQMQDLLADVAEQSGATVIFVTHDIDEALHLADRVVVLAGRGEGIQEILRVPLERPRDRSRPELVPLRSELLSRFGIQH